MMIYFSPAGKVILLLHSQIIFLISADHPDDYVSYTMHGSNSYGYFHHSQWAGFSAKRTTRLDFSILVNSSETTGMLIYYESPTFFFNPNSRLRHPWFAVAYLNHGSIIFRMCVDKLDGSRLPKIETVVSNSTIRAYEWNEITLTVIDNNSISITINGKTDITNFNGKAINTTNLIVFANSLRSHKSCNKDKVPALTYRDGTARFLDKVPLNSRRGLNGCVRKMLISTDGKLRAALNVASEDDTQACGFTEGCNISPLTFIERYGDILVVIGGIIAAVILFTLAIVVLIKVLKNLEEKQQRMDEEKRILDQQARETSQRKVGPAQGGSVVDYTQYNVSKHHLSENNDLMPHIIVQNEERHSGSLHKILPSVVAPYAHSQKAPGYSLGMPTGYPMMPAGIMSISMLPESLEPSMAGSPNLSLEPSLPPMEIDPLMQPVVIDPAMQQMGLDPSMQLPGAFVIHQLSPSIQFQYSMPMFTMPMQQRMSIVGRPSFTQSNVGDRRNAQ